MTASRPDARAQLRQYFPTPVGVVTLPDAARLNGALKTAILAREQSHPSTQHSNLGGWQSSWDIESWGGPAAGQVLGAARALAAQMTADRQGRKVSLEWKMNAWANVNRQGHGNEFHSHPGSFWSGCYYVEDGYHVGEDGVAADPDLGGEFELLDPRGVGPAMYAPHLAFAFPAGLSVGAAEVIRPESGMLILFPAWLSHGVRPYRGDALRISLAFNLSL